MSESTSEILERARHHRVELGAFTVEELWRAGVPLPGVKRRPDPPPADRVPGGMGTFRRLAKAPAPSLAAQVSEADGDSLHVYRLGEVLVPGVAKVVEQRRGQKRFPLCVQPVAELVEELVSEARLGEGADGRAARFLVAFSHRFTWVQSRGRLRRSAWTLDVEDLSADERVYLDIRLTTGSPAQVGHEISPAASRRVPGFAIEPGVDGIAASLTGFAGTLWDQFAPGPKPLSARARP